VRARAGAALLLAAALATAAGAAPGDAVETEGEPPSAAASSEEERKLAEDFSDPLTTLPQLFLQDVYTPSSYGTEAQANRVIFRAIVPRVPEFTLLPLVQLIRPSLSLVTVPTGPGKGTRTEFGDVQLFDLFVLPGSSRATGFYMAAGPLFVFPTATHPLAGQGAWQVGPAFATVYKGIPGLLFGGLVQNPIPFAYTSSRRPPSSLLVQPIVLAYLGRGFYAKSGDSTWSVAWQDEKAVTLPLSFGLGYVWIRAGANPLNFFVSGEWLAYRRNAPVAAQNTVRFGLTVAFPELSPW